MTPKISQRLSLGTFLPLGYAVELRKSVVALCGTMWFPHIDTVVDLAPKRNKINGLGQKCISPTCHRSREFIEFLKCLDAVYPASTAIKLILDNHSAHISRETRAWLDARPPGRFEFTFTPKHGSWLNLIEGFFSKFARSVLHHIRVTSKHELKERIIAGIDDVNRPPSSTLGHTNSPTPPDMIRTKETLT